MNFNNQYRPGAFGGLPVVTKNILIINVVVFLLTIALQSTQNIDLAKYLGLHYPTAPDFKPHQFVTYIFMHGSFSHILFNMLAVYIFGQVLEQVWGPKRYLIFYILTGFGAALAQYIVIYFSVGPLIDSIQATQNNLNGESINALLNSLEFQNTLSSRTFPIYETFVEQYNRAIQSNSPRALSLASQFLLDYKNEYLNGHVVVGASGSLFGLLGAFGMLFPNRQLYLYFLFPVKAKWLVIAYGAFELFSGLRSNPQDNVAHFAHIGGLVVGIIIVLLWRKDKQHLY
ncbi:MAG: rhomboid family intramembrane serine protease [Bacteroidetes bacterium]|nr:rhomboid family intramembrane serine protease [Bacteroidota bacterium]